MAIRTLIAAVQSCCTFDVLMELRSQVGRPRYFLLDVSRYPFWQDY